MSVYGTEPCLPRVGLRLGDALTFFMIPLLFAMSVRSKVCVPRDFGHGSVVCVCNASYCDSTPVARPLVPAKDSFYWYVSSKDGYRLRMFRGNFSSVPTNNDIVLTVRSEETYQTIQGWGGAFTDSAGINMKRLSQETQENLMQSYFGTEGSRYTLGRVPIGGCDFSTRAYTYDDVTGDILLRHFSLANEDLNYKIPFMKWALQLRSDLRFLSAAWTAPPWMKTNNAYNGFGFLKREYYQTYTDYLLKFVREYRQHGIDMWGISTGNEPINAFIPFLKINSMGWTPWTMARWIADYLGPSLAQSRYNETIILTLDDQRIELPWYVELLFRNEDARRYTTGIATHMYYDKVVPARVLDKTRAKFPEKLLLVTEASIGAYEKRKVILGSWERGETYILNIMENVNHGVSGWIDWNLALDETGGPSWIENYVDAAIIVNKTSDEFYKQPMYYAIKHVSRFVERGSVRIGMTDSEDVKSTAFVNSRNEIIVILCNTCNRQLSVRLRDPKKGNIDLQLRARSMNTVIYER